MSNCGLTPGHTWKPFGRTRLQLLRVGQGSRHMEGAVVGRGQPERPQRAEEAQQRHKSLSRAALRGRRESEAVALTSQLWRQRQVTIRESMEGGRKEGDMGTWHIVLLRSPLASRTGLQGWEQQGPSCQRGCKQGHTSAPSQCPQAARGPSSTWGSSCAGTHARNPGASHPSTEEDAGLWPKKEMKRQPCRKPKHSPYH